MPEAITPEKLRDLAKLPYGEAGKYIRNNVDPLWGLDAGSAVEFTISIVGILKRAEQFDGTITLSAYSEDQAKKMAGILINNSDPAGLIKWDSGNPFHEDWDEEDWGTSVIDRSNDPLTTSQK